MKNKDNNKTIFIIPCTHHFSECEFDGGDCCNPWASTDFCQICECNDEDVQGSFGGNTFKEQVIECITKNPGVNLTNLASRMMKPRNESIQGILTKGLEAVENWSSLEEKVWTSIFHPNFGPCHTFNLRNAEPYKYLPSNQSYQLSFTYTPYVPNTVLTLHNPMIGFLHEENELPEETYSKLILDGIFVSASSTIKKKITLQPQPPLERLPCAKERYSTCIDKEFHLRLEFEYGCKVSIFYSGGHLKQENTSQLPECSNNITLHVS